MLEGSSEACHRRARWWRRSAHLRLAAPVNPAMRACDGQSWWPTWLRSWDLGVGVRSGRLDRRNCEDWLSCRRTSRCSGRSRRRDIGVTSTNRSCGGLAAERQTVRRTTAGFGKVPRMFAGIASVCNGARRAGGAQRPICGDAGSRLAMLKGRRVCGREIGSEVGRSGNGSRGRVAEVHAIAVEPAVAADDPAAGTLV
jgi:hypothetical protein